MNPFGVAVLIFLVLVVAYVAIMLVIVWRDE